MAHNSRADAHGARKSAVPVGSAHMAHGAHQTGAPAESVPTMHNARWAHHDHARHPFRGNAAPVAKAPQHRLPRHRGTGAPDGSGALAGGHHGWGVGRLGVATARVCRSGQVVGRWGVTAGAGSLAALVHSLLSGALAPPPHPHLHDPHPRPPTCLRAPFRIQASRHVRHSRAPSTSPVDNSVRTAEQGCPGTASSRTLHIIPS